MSTLLTIGLCQSLTRLTRQLLEADKTHAHTHILAKGQIYRVTVELTPIPTEQLHDVVKSVQ